MADGQGAPQLEPVQPPRIARPSAVWLASALIATMAFLVGLSLGGRSTPSPTPVATATSPPAFTSAQISRELWTAYLNRGTEGWALCSIDDAIGCQAISTTPAASFARFPALPLEVTDQDWAALSPISVPAGHYLLAGPVVPQGGSPLLDPQIVLARVAADGSGTLVGSPGQAVLEGALWDDVGTLGPGRYVAVLSGFTLTTTGSSSSVTYTGWVFGLIVQSGS